MPVASEIAFCVCGEFSKTSARVSAKLLTVISSLMILMVIGDFYLFCVALVPNEADAVLIVDANAILAFAIP